MHLDLQLQPPASEEQPVELEPCASSLHARGRQFMFVPPSLPKASSLAAFKNFQINFPSRPQQTRSKVSFSTEVINTEAIITKPRHQREKSRFHQ